METRIKELRQARGLTVEQLAKLAGMSKSYLSEIENGRKQINGRRLDKLAEALDVTVTDLIADPDISADLERHLSILRDLDPEDQMAVMRHALSLSHKKDAK